MFHRFDEPFILPSFDLIKRLSLIHIFGTEATALLQKSAVVIFGLGGVGSYAAEATARAGVGKICLVDGDVVAESNLNRQLVALSSTVGKSKARVMSERIADISKEIRTETMEFFYTEETADRIDLAEFDLSLIHISRRRNASAVSTMITAMASKTAALVENPSLTEK